MGRSEWQLKSMERSVAVCTQLALNPSDPFLQHFAQSCTPSDSGLVPRLPVVSDFLQVASACLPGMYCPSFSDEVVQELPAGLYSNFQFDSNPCTPGHICLNGQQQLCPTGFRCPDSGMSLPIPCAVDPSLSLTCFYSGSIGPTLCPNGTLCGTPIMPPLPAPPGYAQSMTEIDSESNSAVSTILISEQLNSIRGIRQGASYTCRSLTLCQEGFWCGLGRAISEGESLACPAGAACSEPAVLEPIICNLGGNCSPTSCPRIPYCPSGSSTEELCPAGVKLTCAESVRHRKSVFNFCLQGHIAPILPRCLLVHRGAGVQPEVHYGNSALRVLLSGLSCAYLSSHILVNFPICRLVLSQRFNTLGVP